MLTVAAAVGLAALCAASSWRRLAISQRLAARVEEGAEPDEFEERLQRREALVVLALSRGNVRAFSRVALAGGTGLGIWELTGGPAQLPLAASAFVAGVAGWGVCQEALRRLGSLAGSPRSASGGLAKRLAGAGRSRGSGERPREFE